MTIYGKCSCGHAAADHLLMPRGWECTACELCQGGTVHKRAAEHVYKPCFCRRLDVVWGAA